MSAPRKIWVSEHGGWQAEDIYTGTHLYHHDDVVRELAETLERAEMMMRMRGYLEMANECAAALSKIAQDA